MKRHHYYTLSLLLGALALMIGGLDHWSDALKPQFVAGVVTAVAAVLKAMLQDSPNDNGPAQ